MKKFFIFFLMIFTFSLYSCKKEEAIINIAVPSGAPSLATLNLSYNDNYNVDVKSGVSNIKAAFLSNDYDFIIAPTNQGVQLFNANKNYKMVSTITCGNLYLASDFNLNSLQDLNGKKVVLFGKNTVNDMIVNYILKENNVSCNIEYVDDLNTAKTLFLASQSDTSYLLADPQKSAIENNLISQNKTYTFIDIQEEFKKITGTAGFAQASLFVKSSVSSDNVQKVLNDIKENIQFITKESNISDTNVKIKELGYFNLEDSIMYKAIIGSNFNIISGLKGMKDIVDKTYIINLNLVGGELPSEEFYFIQ